MVYKHFSCAPEPSMLPGAAYMILTSTAILSLCHADPWFTFRFPAGMPFLHQLKIKSLNRSLQFVRKDRFLPSEQGILSCPSTPYVSEILIWLQTQAFWQRHQYWSQYWCLGIICFFQSALLLTEKIEKNAARAPEFFNILPRALKTLLINFALFAGTFFIAMWKSRCG